MSKEPLIELSDAEEAQLAATVRKAQITVPSDTARARIEAAVQAEWLASLRESADEEIANPTLTSHRRLRAWSLAAGIAAVSVFAAFAWRANAPQPQVAQLEAIAGSIVIQSPAWLTSARSIASAAPVALHDEITVGSNSIATLRMPSGLGIRLRAGTRINFDANNMLVLQNGTIFVDAVPGADPEFTVQTPAGTVRHLGTQYQVEVDEQRVAVAVRDGAVAVAIDGRAIERATAGSVVTIDVAGRQLLRTEIASHDERFAWIEAQPSPFELDGARLSEFLAWFTHETGIEVRFSPALSSQRFETVTLRGSIAGLAPLKALDVVLASVDLTYADFDGAIVIAAR
jgi:FecR protein